MSSTKFKPTVSLLPLMPKPLPVRAPPVLQFFCDFLNFVLRLLIYFTVTVVFKGVKEGRQKRLKSRNNFKRFDENGEFEMANSVATFQIAKYNEGLNFEFEWYYTDQVLAEPESCDKLSNRVNAELWKQNFLKRSTSVEFILDQIKGDFNCKFGQFESNATALEDPFKRSILKFFENMTNHSQVFQVEHLLRNGQ